MRRAWEVLLVLDRDCDRANVDSPARYMPVWLIGSPTNLEIARELRTQINGLQPLDVTTFDDIPSARPSDPASFVEILDLHHPYMTRLNIIGAGNSNALSAIMERYGFAPTKAMWDETIGFRRPIPYVVDIPTFHLEAATWKTSDDVYDALFAAVGAPTWHGRNFDALNDSIVTGDINCVEVPYRLVINTGTCRPRCAIIRKRTHPTDQRI